MRFYLESAVPGEVAAAAHWPFVAGVVTGSTSGEEDSVPALLELVVATGRADWKLWLGLPPQSVDGAVDVATAANDRLAQLTGGALAGPTLVFKLAPGSENLWAASSLIRSGMEVCVTGSTTPLQGLAASWLPHVVSGEKGRVETEGPPASRNPHAPHYVAVDVGEIDRHGGDGTAVVRQLNDLYGTCKARTRILACGIHVRSRIDELLAALALCRSSVVDLAMPFWLLKELSGEP
jgi:hypothetical protein